MTDQVVAAVLFLLGIIAGVVALLEPVLGIIGEVIKYLRKLLGGPLPPDTTIDPDKKNPVR